MRWTWDRDKNETNFQKHGIRFDTAEFVFLDPLALSDPDPSPDEERWRTLGLVRDILLFVVHTWPESENDEGDPVGRIISARRATPRERRAYEDG
jgi:uncharacterized DUF497 family protein